jgi:FkbM family methyltransferase
VTKTQTVAGIVLPANDLHFAEQLRSSPVVDGRGTYQLAKLRAAIAFCPGDRRRLAVDVGAHVGLWTLVLASSFEEVMAFEPLSEHVVCLRQNVQHLSNVVIRPVALGATEGQVGLRRIKDVATSQVCEPIDAECCAPIRRLDDQWFGGPIDFLKIDAEGFEHFVVQGGSEVIRRDKPVVVLEQKKRYLARYGLDRRQPTVKLLQSWGMVEFWAKSGDHCLGWP